MPGPLLPLTSGDPQRPPRVFDLEQPRTAAMPIHPAHLPGYSYVLHRRHQDTYGQDGPRSGASGMIVTMEHTGTHIDALCHQAQHPALCGGVPADATTQPTRGFTRHGVEEIAPIVGPGVLLDVAAMRGVEALASGYAVTVDMYLGDRDALRAGYGPYGRPSREPADAVSHVATARAVLYYAEEFAAIHRLPAGGQGAERY